MDHAIILLLIGAIIIIPIILLGLRLLWGFFPALLCLFGLVCSLLAFDLTWIWLAGLWLLGGLLGCWLWQRSLLYLHIDAWLEKRLHLDD